MELSFEYYDWLKWLNENSPVLIFISLFGSFIFLIVMGLTMGLLRNIGLRFITDREFLGDFMICVFATGFIGGFLLLLLSAVVLPTTHTDGMNGIRFILILGALFICISVFYVANKVSLKKWFDEVVDSTSKTGSNSSGKGRRSKKMEVRYEVEISDDTKKNTSKKRKRKK